MQAVAPSPHPVRVKVLKGFYCNTSNRFRAVNPGDVIEIPGDFARQMGGKVEPTQEPLRIDENYLPDRKRNRKPDAVTELSQLRNSVDALTKVVTALVEGQAGNKASGGKTNKD